MTSDEAALWRAVEAAPGDRMPLVALADYLEERGQGETAYALRWMAAHGKAPRKAGDTGWHWGSQRWADWKTRRAALPPCVFHSLPSLRGTPTLRESVRQLGRALAAVLRLVAADL